MPSARRRASVSPGEWTRSSSELSVSSSTRLAGSTPLVRTTCETESTRFGSATWRADRFTWIGTGP